jgi:hypothetical protein
MMYKLVFETTDIKQLQDIASFIEELQAEAQLPLPTASVKEKKNRVKNVEEPTKELIEKFTPTSNVEPTKEVTYEDVRKATLDLIKAKGKQAALDVLNDMKVASAPELKPEQYAEYLKLATTAKSRL